MDWEQMQLAAALELFVAQLEDAFEASIMEIASLRCTAAMYSAVMLQQTLKKQRQATKNTALYLCKQHGRYHLYSISEVRRLAEACRTAALKPHRPLLRPYQLGTPFERSTMRILNAHLDALLTPDRRFYIEQRLRFEHERKIAYREQALACVPLTGAQLTEFSSCYRKQAHPTPNHAAAHLAQLVGLPNSSGGILHTYQCSYCTGWHVGHQGAERGSNLFEDRLIRAWELFAKRPETAAAFCQEKGINYVDLMAVLRR